MIIVYDISKRDSFIDVERWVRKTEITCAHAKSKIPPIIVVGNKSDLEKRLWEVDTKEAARFAESQGYLFQETSASTGHNVLSVFVRLAVEALVNLGRIEESVKDHFFSRVMCRLLLTNGEHEKIWLLIHCGDSSLFSEVLLDVRTLIAELFCRMITSQGQ